MEIQHGKGPWAPPVSGIVPLGSTLTLVVAINDYRGNKPICIISIEILKRTVKILLWVGFGFVTCIPSYMIYSNLYDIYYILVPAFGLIAHSQCLLVVT